MTESRDEWIKKRAYAIWEEEGYPTGRDASHWEQASKERAVMEKTAPHGIAVAPKAKRKSAAASAAPTKVAKAPAVKAVPAEKPKTSSEKTETVAKRAPRKTPAKV